MSGVQRDEILGVFDLINEVRTLVVRLEGSEQTPGLLAQVNACALKIASHTTEAADVADRLHVVVDLKNQISDLKKQVGEVPSKLLAIADGQQFRSNVRAVLQDEIVEVLAQGRDAAVEIVGEDLEKKMADALLAAEQRVYGDTLISQKTLLIQNEEFTAEIVRLNGVIAEMDKQKVDAAKDFADLAEDFGKRLMRVYTTRLVPVAVVSLICGAALSLTPLFPMLLEMINRR